MSDEAKDDGGGGGRPREKPGAAVAPPASASTGGAPPVSIVSSSDDESDDGGGGGGSAPSLKSLSLSAAASPLAAAAARHKRLVSRGITHFFSTVQPQLQQFAEKHASMGFAQVTDDVLEKGGGAKGEGYDVDQYETFMRFTQLFESLMEPFIEQQALEEPPTDEDGDPVDMESFAHMLAAAAEADERGMTSMGSMFYRMMMVHTRFPAFLAMMRATSRQQLEADGQAWRNAATRARGEREGLGYRGGGEAEGKQHDQATAASSSEGKTSAASAAADDGDASSSRRHKK